MKQDSSNSPPAPPEKKPGQPGGALHSLVEAEKLMQIALLIPCATLVGWLIGAGLDKWLHQTWIFIPGLLLGATAGFVQMFRTVLQHTKE
jgi:F0F1-type ATP synthase assembly protein I